MDYKLSTYSVLGCITPKKSCFNIGDLIVSSNLWTYTIALIQNGKVVDTAKVSQKPLFINKKTFPHLKKGLFSNKVKGKIYTFYTAYEDTPNDFRACFEIKDKFDGKEITLDFKTCATILSVDFNKIEYWVNDCNIVFNEKSDIANFSYTKWFEHMIFVCFAKRLKECKNEAWVSSFYHDDRFVLPDDVDSSPNELKEFMKKMAKDIEYEFSDIGIKTCVRFCGKNDKNTLCAFSTPDEVNHRGFGSILQIK
ncbi:MAG TPA: hypothetical protein DD377_05170 [Firmicutes bacterium]|nr:hypothetical protein [Bacillota bacterium]